MEPSSLRGPRRSQNSPFSRRFFVVNRLGPSIRGKSCPICLTQINDRRSAAITACLHAYCVECIRKWSKLSRKCPLCNAEFDAWFCKINFSSKTFVRRQLPALGDKGDTDCQFRSRRRDPLAEQRVLRRSREEFTCSNQQTRPLPRRRWFGRSERESSDAVVRRILHWRCSIYEQRLQAVPHFSWSHLEWNTSGNKGAWESMLRRIEPWIRRELQAILGDPDPSIIVHVASSVFMSSLEVPAERPVSDDNYLAPLRPFLHERTNMFWHELRCFAGSPFNMETYDTIVEYTEMT